MKINHQLNEIKNNYHTAWKSYELLKNNYENQRLAFERSEDKFKEDLIDAYTLFITGYKLITNYIAPKSNCKCNKNFGNS
uniref:hypothetical protein n=1 Tax=Ornithobacterium rhinotracheale TaxID=28251 RepID=UPI0039A68299